MEKMKESWLSREVGRPEVAVFERTNQSKCSQVFSIGCATAEIEDLSISQHHRCTHLFR